MNVNTRCLFSIIILVSLAVFMGGCTNSTTGETDPRPADISVSFDDIRTNQSHFLASGEVRLDLNVNDSVQFNDVTVCAYDTTGTLLSSQILGTLAAPNDSRSFRLLAAERPMHIVVDHPRFQDYPSMGPVVFTWDDYYQQYREENRNALPFEYDFDHPIGTCPGA